MTDQQITTPAATVIEDVTTADFRQKVLEESLKYPVLVDFWAPWCGPCKQLAPVLEKAVRASGGKVKLVKMNIDEHPQIAGQLGIKSIPAVIAFQKGQPVDGFMGAVPERQITGFIERLVGPIESPAAELIAAGEAALERETADEALAAFQAALDADPASLEALGGLARAMIALGEHDEAEALLSQLPPEALKNTAISAAQAALNLARQAADVPDLSHLEARIDADPNDLQARFELAIGLNAAGQREPAADQLLEIMRINRGWNDEAARQKLLEFFEAWGHMDPHTVAARRKLSTQLFS